MKKFLLFVLLVLGALSAPASAQQAASALVVSTCGTLPAGVTYAASTYGILTMDTTGKLCDSATGGGGGSNSSVSTTGTAVPGSGTYIGFNSGGNLTGVSSANPLPVVGQGATAGSATSGLTFGLDGAAAYTVPVASGTYTNGNSYPLTQDLYGGLRISETAPAAFFMQNAAVANGNGVAMDVGGRTSVWFDVDCTVACSGGTTINFQAQGDVALGAWPALLCYQVGLNTPVTSATTTGQFQCPLAGATSVRATITNYSAGTITVKGLPTTAAFAPPNQTTVSVTGAVSNASSGAATSSTNIPNISYNYGFNGTTWDQLQVDSNKYLKTDNTSWANGVLGAMANYGTSPGAILVPGVNAFVTNTVSVTGTFFQTTQPVSVASLPALTTSTAAIGTVGGNVNVTPTNCSGTITTGGTAQNAFAATATIHGFTIANIDSTAGSGEPLWISFTTTAAPSTAGSYPLSAPAATTFTGLSSYSSPLGFGMNTALSVIGATTGHKFSCTYY